MKKQFIRRFYSSTQVRRRQVNESKLKGKKAPQTPELRWGKKKVVCGGVFFFIH